MLGRLFHNAIGPGDIPWTGRWDQDIDTAPATWAGAHVTTESAQQLLVVYGATAFHADHCSTMPIDQYRRTADGQAEEVPVSSWLDSPYAGVDITDAQSQMWWSYWLGGHILAHVVRESRGRVTAVVPLHPDHWHFHRMNGRWQLFVDGRPMGGEFLSVPHVLVPGQVRGVNPIEAARQAIGAGLATAESAGRFFAQGSQLAGVLKFPGDPPNADDRKVLRDNWVKTNGGSSRAHLPGILFGGAEWQQISVTPEQAQFLETRRFTDAQICAQLFQLPPTAMAIPVESGSTIQYQNIESAWAEIVRRWLPHLTKLRRAYNRLLPPGQFMRFNVDRYLEATTKERYEAYKVGIDAGFLVPNEPRRKEDMPPLDGGDDPRPAKASTLTLENSA